MTTQNDNPQKKTLPWLPICLVLAIIAYPLSVGPLVWLEERDVLLHSPHFEALEEALAVFYTPLNWMYDQNDTFASFLIWYCDLWR